jgi:hypothetical protein
MYSATLVPSYFSPLLSATQGMTTMAPSRIGDLEYPTKFLRGYGFGWDINGQIPL